MERSGVHVVKSGPVLAHNLRAQFEELPLRVYHPGDNRYTSFQRQTKKPCLAGVDFRSAANWHGGLKRQSTRAL